MDGTLIPSLGKQKLIQKIKPMFKKILAHWGHTINILTLKVYQMFRSLLDMYLMKLIYMGNEDSYGRKIGIALRKSKFGQTCFR